MENLNAVKSILNLIPMNIENTYVGEDGLLYCTKCHTLRCTKEPVPVFDKRMPVICECMKEEERKEKERDVQIAKQAQLDRLRGASLLGDRYKNTTFANTDLDRPDDFKKAFQRCRKFCQIPDQALEHGYGVYIYGDSGTGKTHLTACMCNELMSQLKQCLFTNFFEIAKLIQRTWNGNEDASVVIKRICDVDFLFLDDLGTEQLTKGGEDNWLQGQVFDIINKRYNNKKPTIFSSNYSMNELIKDRGMMKKTVDRIGEMSTAMIKLTGESYRRKSKGGLF